MKFKYDPKNFEFPLNKFMQDAYDAYIRKDSMACRGAAEEIQVELKWSYKSGILDRKTADEMKDYFWSFWWKEGRND